MPRKKQNPAPSPTDVLRKQLVETRNRRGWTQQQLAERLDNVGAPIDRSTIAKIEGGTRGVSLDEAMWIAVALGVSPLALVLPREESDVAIAPTLRVSGWDAVTWFRGIEAIGDSSEDDKRFFWDAAPDHEAKAWRRIPGLQGTWIETNMAIGYASDPDRTHDLATILEDLADVASVTARLVRREVKEST